ncbi:FAD-binding oxidoreductase [Dermatobacter hominis]|uniref:FAD-binding oxidoreductase n=1 Tax=Dermatobacter hominis TaxID=2884263 RepID=UPI001D122F8F|nr:FAD-binding oxidoreductase [Dermatobacter hominis]UDY35410.1 FAD-binding oxidoreductase [Dermatobacter hominis]
MDEWLDELAGALGPGAVLRPGSDVLDGYEQPARGTGGHAAAVVRPASTDDVRATVRWAVAHDVGLLQQGANTGLVGASVPPAEGARPLVVLSTERLVEPVEVFVDDRVAIVPAGVRLSALNELVAAHDLALPIDLGADPSLGGMVATNTGGARMLHDGDVRRRVLGLEVVLADVDPATALDPAAADRPTVLDDLTRLRKDNTGPRLSSAFVGSAGALGVVTRVAVELSRRPREQACALLAPVDAAGAIAALRVVEGALGTLLSAYEVMSATAVEMAVSTLGRRAPWSEAHPAADGRVPEVTVLVEAAGPSHVDDALAAAVADATASGTVLDAVLVPFDDAWGLRHSISEGLARTGTVVGFDVSVPRSELVAFRTDVIARVAEALPRAVVADFGHWADGGTHCNLVFPDAPPTPDEREEARRIVFSTAVHDHAGSYSAEHGIGPHNADWWTAVTPPGDRALVRTLRDACDPHRVLGHPALPF